MASDEEIEKLEKKIEKLEESVRHLTEAFWILTEETESDLEELDLSNPIPKDSRLEPMCNRFT